MSYDNTYCSRDLCPNLKCERYIVCAVIDRDISIVCRRRTEYCAEQNANRDLCVRHKGYVLTQAGGTGEHHIMISKDDQMLMHIAYTGGMLTHDEAVKKIEDYVEFIKAK